MNQPCNLSRIQVDKKECLILQSLDEPFAASKQESTSLLMVTPLYAIDDHESPILKNLSCRNDEE